MSLVVTLEGIAAFRAQGGPAEQVVAEVYDRIAACPDQAV